MVAQLPSDPRFPEYGSLVGSWIVRERIGSGSHGVVFRAVRTDQPESDSYALKLAQEPGDERFEREAQLLSRLSHPSVPRFEGSGTWTSPQGEAYPYVVMQWVEGLSLYAWAAEHGLTLRQALGQLAQVARALEATHQHGVHRDVKGGNVRVSPQGHAVLLDFGSCWYPGASPLTGRAMPPSTGPYRSPQQLFFEYALTLGAGQYYEAQSADDVYALGITAYRLLAGTYPPRDSGSDDGSGGAVRLVAPRGLNDACPELSALILRMLSEDPEARGGAGQVAEELERLLKHTRPALDRHWVAKSSGQPTEKARRPAPIGYVQREPARRSAAAGVFLMLVLLWGLLTRDVDQREVASATLESEPQAAENPDAGTSGLGEEGLASVAPAGTPPVSEERIAREVPTDPRPGQKRPPCNHRSATVINGGCWLRPAGAERAPCELSDYEHEGRCYVPLLTNAVRVPTSEEPR
jgi:serine/threonine protein kinase